MKMNGYYRSAKFIEVQMRVLFYDDEQLKKFLINSFTTRSRECNLILKKLNEKKYDLDVNGINKAKDIELFLRLEYKYLYFRNYGFPANFLTSSFQITVNQLFCICYGLLLEFYSDPRNGNLNDMSCLKYKGLPTREVLPYRSYIWTKNYCAAQSIATMYQRLVTNNPAVFNCDRLNNDHFLNLVIHGEFEEYTEEGSKELSDLVYYKGGLLQDKLDNSGNSKLVDIRDVYETLFFPTNSQLVPCCFDSEILLSFEFEGAITAETFFSSGIQLSTEDVYDNFQGNNNIAQSMNRLFEYAGKTDTFYQYIFKKFTLMRRESNTSGAQNVKRLPIVSYEILKFPIVLTIHLDENYPQIPYASNFIGMSIDREITFCSQLYCLNSVCYYGGGHFFCRTLEYDCNVYQYDGLGAGGISVAVGNETPFPLLFNHPEYRLSRAKLLFYVKVSRGTHCEEPFRLDANQVAEWPIVSNFIDASVKVTDLSGDDKWLSPVTTNSSSDVLIDLSRHDDSHVTNVDSADMNEMADLLSMTVQHDADFTDEFKAKALAASDSREIFVAPSKYQRIDESREQHIFMLHEKLEGLFENSTSRQLPSWFGNYNYLKMHGKNKGLVNFVNRMNKELLVKNKTAIPVPYDGICMFYAFLASLEAVPTEKSPQKLREIICEELESCQSTLFEMAYNSGGGKLLEGKRYIKDPEICQKLYINNMKKTNTYGSEVELRIMMELFHVDVIKYGIDFGRVLAPYRFKNDDHPMPKKTSVSKSRAGEPNVIEMYFYEAEDYEPHWWGTVNNAFLHTFDTTELRRRNIVINEEQSNKYIIK